MPDAPPPFVPDATLAEVAPGWWLELRCASCVRPTRWPRALLVEAYGVEASVPALLARLRCQTCWGRPVTARWVDSPAGGAHGSGCAPKRRVPLALPCRQARPRCR
jgi:hypothetical protein